MFAGAKDQIGTNIGKRSRRDYA